MATFIGATTPSQRACLSKEFRKLYAKKTFIPRKQKIAIALNTCDVGIKGVKKDYTVTFRIKRFGGYTEDVYVEAINEKQGISLGTKKIRELFPRTHIEFVKIQEFQGLPVFTRKSNK